ncbi:NADP-specific glutamate dehydrogenase, partial [Pseudolycoriella hygida]
FPITNTFTHVYFLSIPIFLFGVPSPTQNEINGADAKVLAANGCKLVVEGANMPTTKEAMEAYTKKEIILCPGKAANAGEVSV